MWPLLLPPQRRRCVFRPRSKGEEMKEMVGLGGNSSTSTGIYYLSKCKKIGFSMDECIPNELLFNILLCLPAQDIYYASRLVCRKWYRIMRTKNFIHEHLEHASYGILYRDESGDVVFVSAREGGGGIVDTYKLNYVISNTCWHSCNGLMLECEVTLNMFNPIYYVVNDVTDQAFRLPPFPYLLSCLVKSVIGYDAASMTYKVVVPCHDTGYDCAIFTVGVDKSWRRVRVDHLSDLGKRTIHGCPSITEGFVHWNKWESAEVVTLNLETEIISETPPPIPKAVLEKQTKCHCLSTGKYLPFFLQRGKLVWRVYEMKPETGEWRKLSNICLEGQEGRMERLGFRHDNVVIKPCGWLKYPEVLALRIQHVFIIFYNLITCEIDPQKLCTFKQFLPVTLHKNSLLRMNIYAIADIECQVFRGEGFTDDKDNDDQLDSK